MRIGKTSVITAAERVRLALLRQKPDRVPHFEWSIHPNIINKIIPGASYEEFIEQTENDAIWVSPAYKRRMINSDTFEDEWGIIRRIDPVEGYPTAVKGPIRSVRDLNEYKVPIPDETIRLAALESAVKKLKGNKAIGIRLRDVFSYPRDLLGYEGVMIALAAQPELVKKIAEISLEHTSCLARRAASIGAEVVMFGDDYCDAKGPIMGPKLFQEILYPIFKRLAENIKTEGLFLIKHTDGNVMPIIDLLVQSGIDCLDPIDPMAGLDLSEIKLLYGEKIAIKGNIPCAGVLQYGSPEEVSKAVREAIVFAGQGGGYVCSSSNSIHSGVKPENYIALMNTIAHSGVYDR